MPDLARYAGTVLGAYGVALALIAFIVALTWERSARVRRRLAEVEARTESRTESRAGARRADGQAGT